MSVTSPRYSERSKYTNRSMEWFISEVIAVATLAECGSQIFRPLDG